VTARHHREFSPYGEPVLHREQRRRRTRRNADLAVGVLNMPVRCLDRDPKGTRDLLGLQAPRQQADDLGLAFGQP
jgi:hypothetical protein